MTEKSVSANYFRKFRYKSINDSEQCNAVIVNAF